MIFKSAFFVLAVFVLSSLSFAQPFVICNSSCFVHDAVNDTPLPNQSQHQALQWTVKYPVSGQSMYWGFVSPLTQMTLAEDNGLLFWTYPEYLAEPTYFADRHPPQPTSVVAVKRTYPASITVGSLPYATTFPMYRAGQGWVPTYQFYFDGQTKLVIGTRQFNIRPVTQVANGYQLTTDPIPDSLVPSVGQTLIVDRPNTVMPKPYFKRLYADIPPNGSNMYARAGQTGAFKLPAGNIYLTLSRPANSATCANCNVTQLRFFQSYLNGNSCPSGGGTSLGLNYEPQYVGSSLAYADYITGSCITGNAWYGYGMFYLNPWPWQHADDYSATPERPMAIQAINRAIYQP